MKSQVNAVYAAIKTLKNFDDGDKVTLTKEEKSQVVAIVVAGFEADEVALSEKAKAKHNTTEALTKYTNGMVDNHLRKDIRINGGSPYVTKNPGSRAGSGDAIVKNLKLLKTTMTDETKIAEIDSAIQARQAELQAEKAKKVEIDFDAIPAELREKLGL